MGPGRCRRGMGLFNLTYFKMTAAPPFFGAACCGWVALLLKGPGLRGAGSCAILGHVHISVHTRLSGKFLPSSALKILEAREYVGEFSP